MELAQLLGEQYVSQLDVQRPENLCQHMVEYIQRNYFELNDNLSPHFVMEVMKQANDLLRNLPNVLRISRACENARLDLFSFPLITELSGGNYSGRVSVIGDLHGQYRDLEYLLSSTGPIGFPSANNQIIVNGDMVDRGDMSVEILIILSLITVLVPGSVHMLRGNHESDRYLTATHGFDNELAQKYPNNTELRKMFAKFFSALPVAAVVDQSVFVVHGGLGRCTWDVDQINRCNRFAPLVQYSPIWELVWNDPSSVEGVSVNSRGEAFGPDVTAKFLAENGYNLLVRSHQYCEDGVKKAHNDQCWTVFSAPNYCNRHHNTGAILQFDQPHSAVPVIVRFSASHYPALFVHDVRPQNSLERYSGYSLADFDGRNAGSYSDATDAVNEEYELELAIALSLSVT